MIFQHLKRDLAIVNAANQNHSEKYKKARKKKLMKKKEREWALLANGLGDSFDSNRKKGNNIILTWSRGEVMAQEYKDRAEIKQLGIVSEENEKLILKRTEELEEPIVEGKKVIQDNVNHIISQVWGSIKKQEVRNRFG